MGAAAILVLSMLGFSDETSRKDAGRPFVGAARKQPRLLDAKDDRYDPIPVQGNIDSFLKQLLNSAALDEEVAQLFDDLRGNPALANLNQEQWREWMTKARSDPRLRQKFSELMKGPKIDGLKADELFARWKEIQQALKGVSSMPAMNMGDGTGGGFRPPPSTPTPPADDKLGRWAKDLLHDVDQSRAGDFLRDSPAWKNGLRDLDKIVKASDVKFDWLRGRMPESLKLPADWAPKLGDWVSRLPALQNLPRWRFNTPNLGRFNVNLGGGGGGMRAPSLGNVSVSENLLWLFVPLLMAVLAWLFYRNLGRVPKIAGAVRRRGPWPVDPAAVTTRTELIRAFDYLALLLLGDQVRTWNHVAVSQKLGQAATDNPAAGALAKLYELARYTPGDDALPPEARDTARRHLQFLARSAAA
jgi:hypothetical protein